MPLIIKVEKMKRQKTQEERRQELLISKTMFLMFVAVLLYSVIIGG